jgi:uncharacterized protein with GYD domain
MLFVLKFKFDPEHTHRVVELWKHFHFPADVKVIHRYLVIGRHMSMAIFDAPDAESLLKITAPFSSLGVAKIMPVMPLEEAIKVQY